MSDHSSMKIYLNEITAAGRELRFTESDAWVLKTVSQADETEISKPRKVDARFALRRVDEVFVADGSIDTSLRLLCSRCANPFDFTCTPKFSALFCTDPTMAGISDCNGNAKRGLNHTFGDARTEGKDVDITFLNHDFIDLTEILAEQIQLKIPVQPLCASSCKGVCPNCGADRNRGRCACDRIVSESRTTVWTGLLEKKRSQIKRGGKNGSSKEESIKKPT